MERILRYRPPVVISVTGAHSGVGKTSLCALILRRIEGLGAIKYTRTELYSAVIDDPEHIDVEGKDTAVMHQAGAERVVWIKGRPEDLPASLEIAFRRLAGLKGAVIEGNSPSALTAPDLNIFVMRADGMVKESAGQVLERADAVVLNTSGDPPPPEGIPAGIPLFRIDLLAETGEIDKIIAFIKQYISRA